MARPVAPANLSKPTMDSRFYIDYSWWEESGKDINLHIEELCAEYSGVEIDEIGSDEEIDWIDPRTAIVMRVDRLMYTFLTECSVHEDFITERSTLIEACFRALLSVGNRPLKPIELAEITGRPADMILKTLSGRRIYKGLRPYPEDND